MTPPEERHRYQEQIGAFLLGKLDVGERTAMQTHLNSCPICQAEVSELEPVVAALADAAPDRIDDDPLPPWDLEESTLAPILGEIPRVQHRRRQFQWSALAAAAICVVAIGLAGITLDPEVSLAKDGARLEVRTAGGELVFFAKLAVWPLGADPGSLEGPSGSKSTEGPTQKIQKPAASGGSTPPKASSPESDAKRPRPGGEKPGAASEASEPGSGHPEQPAPEQPAPESPPPGSHPPGSTSPGPPPADDQYRPQ